MKVLIAVLIFFGSSVSYGQSTDADWTVQIGGAGDQEGNDLVFDVFGNVYVTGIFLIRLILIQVRDRIF
jgi:hypothetical protein